MKAAEIEEKYLEVDSDKCSLSLIPLTKNGIVFNDNLLINALILVQTSEDFPYQLIIFKQTAYVYFSALAFKTYKHVSLQDTTKHYFPGVVKGVLMRGSVWLPVMCNTIQTIIFLTLRLIAVAVVFVVLIPDCRKWFLVQGFFSSSATKAMVWQHCYKNQQKHHN